MACVFSAVTAIAGASLLAAAVLVPAPTGILAVVIPISIACSIATGFELARGFTGLRAARRARALDARPGNTHPLDL